MDCQNCGLNHQPGNCGIPDFRTDGTHLVASVNGVPGEGVDLQRIIVEGETNTRLQLDLDNRRLLYTGERATNGLDSPDSVSIPSVANLINIQELGDVAEGFPSTGDILIYDKTTNIWMPYTIPLGEITSNVGIDDDGMLVKSDSLGGGGGEGAAIPIGGQIIWPTADEAKVPVGFVIADGRELSRTVYAELYTLIGTSYGNGNGTTTFNIPNTKDRVVVGKGDTGSFSTVGATVGEQRVTLGVNEMPSHAHGVYDPGHVHGTNRDPVVTSGGGNNRVYNAGGGQQLAWSQGLLVGAAGTGIGIYTNGGSQSHNNIQPSIVEVHIMRVI